MAKKRTREEVDKNRKLVLKVLAGTREGDVLKALMENPFGLRVQGIVDETGINRSTAKRVAEELVRRGLVMNWDNMPGKYKGTVQGYKFGGLTFPELEYEF